MNILITSAASKVWLVQAFQKALINKGGGDVIAADISTYKPALYFSDKQVMLPKSNDTSYIQEVIKTCKAMDIELVIPTRDAELVIFSRNIKLFLKNNIKVMVSEAKTIETCQDKYLFFEYCKKYKITCISTFLPHEIDKIKYPCLIKPRMGAGARHNFIARNKKKLEQFLSLYDDTDFIIQDYLEEQEYTVDIVSDFNGNVVSIIPRRRVVIENGESIVCRIENEKVIIDKARALAEQLKLIGHSNIQLFYNKKNKQVRFIEVNPRYAGGSDFTFNGHKPSPEIIIELVQNNKTIKNQMVNELLAFKYTKHIVVKNKKNITSVLNNKSIICIDIDGTLCTESCQYEEAQPVYRIIEKVNSLYKQGHKIILLTSRGYSSGYNWIPLLEKQMKEWGVLYHELKAGKPYADYYIDNKAINIFDFI